MSLDQFTLAPMNPIKANPYFCDRCGATVNSQNLVIHDEWHVKLNRALATAGMFGTIGMGEV